MPVQQTAILGAMGVEMSSEREIELKFLVPRHAREALAAVGLLDEILKLPDGLNTVLQTNGAPLSATQALRLMLARAIADRPRLLLIDGTLDALSDDMQHALLARILGPSRPWTVLIATGRQMVIDRCDRVVTLRRNVTQAQHAGNDFSG